jgi:hypothetical protein
MLTDRRFGLSRFGPDHVGALALLVAHGIIDSFRLDGRTVLVRATTEALVRLDVESDMASFSMDDSYDTLPDDAPAREKKPTSIGGLPSLLTKDQKTARDQLLLDDGFKDVEPNGKLLPEGMWDAQRNRTEAKWTDREAVAAYNRVGEQFMQDWRWKKKLKPVHRAVWKRHICGASRATISRELGVGDRTVRNAILRVRRLARLPTCPKS